MHQQSHYLKAKWSESYKKQVVMSCVKWYLYVKSEEYLELAMGFSSVEFISILDKNCFSETERVKISLG